MKRLFQCGDEQSVGAGAVRAGEGFAIELETATGTRKLAVALRRAPNGDCLIEQDGVVRKVSATVAGDVAWLTYGGRTARWQKVEAARGQHGHHESKVRAPMTGRVVLVHVQLGDTVAKGQPLLVVEAMKMEHPLRAPAAGKVSKLLCRVGQLVDTGEELVDIDAE